MTLVLNANSFDEIQVEQEAKEKVNELLNANMQLIMDSIFIPEMKAASFAANLPKPFADGIKFKKTGDNEGNIVNTWGNEEKPLAFWFNYGTRDHGALGPWALHWKDKVTGEDIYAMYVRGVPRTEAMEIGIELGKKRLKREVPRFVEARLK